MRDNAATVTGVTAESQARAPRDSSLSSVRNAARLLKEFESPHRLIGVTDLSRRLHISKSTAHRLLHTLCEEGLLSQDDATGAYYLSTEMFILGCAAPVVADVRSASAPVIEQVRNWTRETVEVSMLDQIDVVSVVRREGQQPRPRLSPVGVRRPATSTISGLVLLAHLPEPRLEDLLGTWSPSSTDRISDLHDLRQTLTSMRAHTWVDTTQHPIDTPEDSASVVAPVRDAHGGVVATICVTGPSQRFGADARSAVVRATMDGARTISQRLGYRDRSGA